MVMMCQADIDVEDLIALGYTCSLADPNVQNFRPGVEIVCDDGICSECIKTGEPAHGRNLGFFRSTTDEDVEDLIAQGYTCSLADSSVPISRPGVEVVCDDGICSQCIRNPRLRLEKISNKELDPEDYLKDRFVCSEEFRNSPDAVNVCDDGHCVGCKVNISYHLVVNYSFYISTETPHDWRKRRSRTVFEERI